MADLSPVDLPDGLAALRDLALDLRWTWSHEADSLWRRIDAETWERTHDPWVLLQDISPDRLRALAADPLFAAELRRLARARGSYLSDPGWFGSTYGNAALKGVAYFSMEYGLGEALPLYAGGLGVLAGDYLKTASDLGVPTIGIGLLYSQGYFRQAIDAGGWQHESYPSNDPGMLPIRPARGPDGGWLHIPLDLPGRTLTLRVGRAQAGRVWLYLLDANNPVNTPADRGITGRLYEAGAELRLLQELVLGIAGWRVVEAVAPDTEICHLNEGHAAFVVIERARCLQRRSGRSFWEAFWATRAGNIFTTHTPVDAGFDRFSGALIATYARALDGIVRETGVPLAELLALGHAGSGNRDEPFNMAYLAMRGAARSIAVSRQHETVSRRIFRPLFPRWPEAEVPVGHVTNGVHVPTWDAPAADRLWTAACGKERWRCAPDTLVDQIAGLSDDELWAMRGAGREALVDNARRRLARHLAARGHSPQVVAAAGQVLDPNILTLGFARRFTLYKRPNLLLRDTARLGRLLTDPRRPAQLVIAGKAHPADAEGKRMIQEWIAFARQPELRPRVVFLEDYDLYLAEELVQGVDVWINTPRRPWEACGTSGMKVLVNGGLNLSVLDGWWEEAYDPGTGWAVGDGDSLDDSARDRRDAAALLDILENEVAPEFYARDGTGLPRAWLSRIRRSMSRLTPAYSSNRMVLDYIERLYLPAASEYRRRVADDCAAATGMRDWECRLRRGWPRVHIGEPAVVQTDGEWRFSTPIYLGDIGVDEVRAELYAEPLGDGPAVVVAMNRGAPVPGGANAYLYAAAIPAGRPREDYTIRVAPAFAGVNVPAELPLILWQR